MNYKEALEKISNINPVNQCWTLLDFYKNNCVNCEENIDSTCTNCPQVIAKQALEPQECSKYHQLIPDNLKRCKNKSQECDVTKCEQYKQNEKGYNDCGYKECANNPNCYFKKWQRVEQLHSQQKTFTVEEVRDFINTHFNIMGFLKLPCKIKNVCCYNANRDCRECLLAEFEKEGE